MNGRSRIYHDMSALLHTPVQLASLMVPTHSLSEYFIPISFISAQSTFSIQWMGGGVVLCHAQEAVGWPKAHTHQRAPPKSPEDQLLIFFFWTVYFIFLFNFNFLYVYAALTKNITNYII